MALIPQVRQLPGGTAQPVKLPSVDDNGSPVDAKHIVESPAQQACLVFFCSLDVPAKVCFRQGAPAFLLLHMCSAYTEECIAIMRSLSFGCRARRAVPSRHGASPAWCAIRHQVRWFPTLPAVFERCYAHP